MRARPQASSTDAAPTVASTSPITGTNGAAIDSTLTITFSESVNATTSSFTLSCGGTGQSFTLSASPASVYMLTPTANLPANTSCTATVLAGQIHDTDAIDPPDTMAANYVFAFGMVTDTAPSVASTSPISGTNGVAASSTITITFDEPVTVGASAFALACPAGTPVSFTNSTGNGPATSFVLTPSSTLPEGTSCTVTVVAAQVHDSDT
ncbi:hypothetical protein SE17_30195, partial [Kouleothrix aurantiaca]